MLSLPLSRAVFLVAIGSLFASALPRANSQQPPFSVSPIFTDKAFVSADDISVAGTSVFWVGWARNDYAVLGHRVDDQGRMSEFLTVSLTTSSPDFKGNAKLDVNTKRSQIYVRSWSSTPVVWVLRFSDQTFSTYLGATALLFNNRTAGYASTLDFSDTTLFIGTVSGSVDAVDLGSLERRLFLGNTICKRNGGLNYLKYSKAVDSLLLSCGSGPTHKVSANDVSVSQLKLAITWAPLMRKDGAVYFGNRDNTIQIAFPNNNYATYSTVELSKLLCPSADWYLSPNQLDLIAVCQESIFLVDGRSLAVTRISLPSIPSQTLYFVSVSKYLTPQGYPVIYTMIGGSLNKINGTDVTQILGNPQFPQYCSRPNTGFELDIRKGPWEYITGCRSSGSSPLLIRQNTASAANVPSPDSITSSGSDQGQQALPTGTVVGIVLAAICGFAVIGVVYWRVRKVRVLKNFDAPLIPEGAVEL